MARTLQIRVDDAMKASVEELYGSLGIDISTAVRMFFSASLRYGGIPFEIRKRRYSDETLEALDDARSRRDLIGPFGSASEMIAYALDSGDTDA